MASGTPKLLPSSKMQATVYDSYSLELWEDIELFCVVQDFCLVTVTVVQLV